MDRKESSYSNLKPRRHEVKLQELRHERRIEADRLDGLKKSLQTKMEGHKKSGTFRAA